MAKAHPVVYRLVRPDGTVIYQEMIAKEMDTGGVKMLHTHIHIRGSEGFADPFIAPPWRWERSEDGVNWVTFDDSDQAAARRST